MTEITRVPLQPVEKGSLTKIWLGVLIALLVGAGIAYASVPKTVTVTEIVAGKGPSPTAADVVLVNYTGKLADGTVFDQGQQTPLPLEGMIPGFAEGLQQMNKGGKYTLFIPAEKAYGSEARGPIPANSDLTFEIELLDFVNGQEFQQRMQAMQQMQQMMQQQGQPGAPDPQAQPQGQ
ncbi:MAG: FKBP-type peptidyl-prolyl cis-trans isomerase [Sphingomonadaceae bacterium]